MRIENNYYLLEIEAEHGRLVRFLDKIGQLELITEPRLAENFRLLLPLGGGSVGPVMHANYILGTQQKLTISEVKADGVKLVWAGPLINERGSYDLSVTIWIELVDREVRFRCEVKNGTKNQLAEVWYGLIGGMTGIGNQNQVKGTKLFLPHGSSQWTAEPFRQFGGGTCGLGVFGPEYLWWYPGHMPMPWASFYHEDLNRGFYYANHDREVRSRLFRMGMEPGIAEGRADGDWPRADELNGLPVGVTLNWINFPYTKPGETFVSGSVVLRTHEGGWQEGAAIYRQWFTDTFGLVDSHKDWLRSETAFLDTMFLLPEDNLNFTFRDIPAWAKTAADHGITSVMISGWHVGGHDRGYPQYEPDPRLGTWEELEAGIRACHKLGLRVYFFANVQTVDISTEWYKTELHKYETKDPWGCPYYVVGWGMGTAGARRGLTRPPMYELDPSHPEVRAILLEYFRKLAEIGADGIHLDKNFTHPLDFNPRLNISPDRAIAQGMLRCIEEILESCRAIRPDFCLSFENTWDQLFSYSDVMWWAIGPSPLKITFPQWVSTGSIPHPFAYNQVNVLVLGGQNILIGPAHYMRGMDYPPMKELSKYIGEVNRIRRELHEYVSRGRWVDSHVKLFASRKPTLLQSGPFAASTHSAWTVFADTNTGKRAVVLANQSGERLEVNGLSLSDNSAGACRIYQPFEPMRESRFPVSLSLPSERLAFIVEA